MFNVTIIRLKDIAKIIFIMIAIYFFTRIILNKSNMLNYTINFNTDNFIYVAINEQSHIIKEISCLDTTNSEEQTEEMEENLSIIKNDSIFQMASIIFEAEEKQIGQDEAQIETSDVQEESEIISSNNENITQISSEVVTQNPIAETYTQEYNGVKIKNETSYELSTELLNPDTLEINTKNVIIFHTHTCESYTESENYKYTASGNFRTTDLNYSVARVGDELANFLSGYGFNVNHNKTYHDYPAYTGSYTRSLSTVQGILNDFDADIIIDLHRDAIGSNSSYAPTVKIGEDYCAQIMFVMGTNGGGLSHSNWSSNLKFAIKIQQKANELYPGLFKPIVLRNSRYNQHLGKAACIIEVGATGNTLEQTLLSMKYLSQVMNEALN